MSEFPKDILDAAEKAFNAALEAPTFGGEDIKIIAAYILAERKKNQWQPIETAPKERQRRIILALPSGIVTEGYWGAAKYNRRAKDYDLAWVSSPYSGDVSPTHWMPLPSAPHHPINQEA